MSNHIQHLLELWYPKRDELQWVLASIIDTDGSSYRKKGAMMMINSLGQYHGVLSGGCLESDIMRQSRRCWDDKQSRIIQYDMREEEDLAWQLGIGCGGMVKILLQPVSAENDYLALDELKTHISRSDSCIYALQLSEGEPKNLCAIHKDRITESLNQGQWFIHQVRPRIHLGIFGGGIDAIPVAALAADLGWQVSVVDPRPSHARSAQFPRAEALYKQSFHSFGGEQCLQTFDAIVIMTHNLSLDGEALKVAQNSHAKYVGMLGPVHRTKRVLDTADLRLSDLDKPLANPIGLRLGGELPESIALSMLAEIHASLYEADGQSISAYLPNILTR